MRRRCARLVSSLLAFVVVGGHGFAAAQAPPETTGIGLGPVALHPALGLEVGYDDNVTLKADEPVDDVTFRGIGRLDLRMPREAGLRFERRPPSRDLLLLAPTDLLALVDPLTVFPGDVERLTDEPPLVPARATPQATGYVVDLGYQVDGVVFAEEGDFDTADQSLVGGAAYRFARGLTLGAGGEWVDRTTSTSDVLDVAQFASDLRLVGADFDRGVAGLTARYEIEPGLAAEVGYAYYVSTIGDEPFDLFGFHIHSGSVGVTYTRPSGLELAARYEPGRIDGEATAEALRRSGLVEPFVPLDFEDDPRAAFLQQGWLEATWPFDARFTGRVRGGVQARAFDEGTLSGFVSPLVEAELSYAFGVSSEARLLYRHTPVDVFGEDGAFLVRDQAQAAVSLRFAHGWTLETSADGGFDDFDDESSLTGDHREDTFFGGTIALLWQPAGWLTVRSDYTGRVRSSNVSAEDTIRDRIRLSALFRY